MTLIYLTPEAERKVRPLRYQDPKLTIKDLDHLKQWIRKQPHLPQDHDDAWLESFLCGCKYSLEKCKRKLDGYYTVRTTMPQYFVDRDPSSEEIRSTMSYHAQFALPSLHPDGHLIGFGSFYYSDGQTIDWMGVVRKISIAADCLIREVKNHGIIFVIDLKELTLQDCIRMSPSWIRDLVYLLEEAYPFTVIGVHYLNTPSFIDVVRKMFWLVLPEKIKQRFHFHGDNYDQLYEFVPQELLPNEYGGNAGTVRDLNEEYQRKLEKCGDWFLEESAKTVNESKRSKDIFHSDKLFGSEGSFKKISID